MHKPIDVGTRLELLVDDFLPDTMRSVRTIAASRTARDCLCPEETLGR